MRDTKGSRTGYRQIADELRSRIQAGALAPGSALPSEAALAEQFSVARGTARRAVELLEQEGLVNIVRGLRLGDTNAVKHRQVTDALRQRITRGNLKPGESLPSESEVCTEFGVSRTTARQAFAELERAGLARAEEGSGRVVTVPPFFHDDGDLVHRLEGVRRAACL